jgi:hypothetical protein
VLTISAPVTIPAAEKVSSICNRQLAWVGGLMAGRAWAELEDWILLRPEE